MLERLLALLLVGMLAAAAAEAAQIPFSDVPAGTLVRTQYESIGLRVEGSGSLSGLAIDEGQFGSASYGNSGPRVLHVGRREEPTTLRFIDPGNPSVTIGARSVSLLVGDGDPDEETLAVTYYGVNGATLLGPVLHTTTTQGLLLSETFTSLGAPIGSVELRLVSMSASGITADDLRFELVGSTPVARLPMPGGRFELYTDASLTTPGLIGSYVDSNLRSYAQQDDWRLTQVVAGTRIDPVLAFEDANWGLRSEVGITGGSGEDWDDFSVQWDGYVRVIDPGLRLATVSDDGSRLWIDSDRDGHWDAAPPEFLDNHWGTGQPPIRGDASPPLAAGVYPIRIQYEEGYGGSTLHLVPFALPTVRFAYLVPGDRTPQANAITNLETAVIPLLRGWFCDQMERNGAGRTTPRFERDSGGAFLVHQLMVPATAAMLRVNEFAVEAAALAAGAQSGDGQIWVLIPEAHRQLPTGEIEGWYALGRGDGLPIGEGIAWLGSTTLGFITRTGLLDTRPYAGLVLPAIGPYPLVQNVSFPWFEGTTLSSVVSSHLGAFAHEMTHAFAIGHDSRNDALNGNLMFNGLRGIRGALFPQRFPAEHTRLEWSTAQALALNSFFESCSASGAPTSSDVLQAEDKPSLSVSAPPVNPAQGHLVVDFTASDPDGLAFAMLLRNGDHVDELPLAGVSYAGSLRSAWFEPGVAEPFEVVVYDVQGNRAAASATVTAQSGPNRAPRPFIAIDRSQAAPGQAFTLVSQSQDPESPSSELVHEWQLEANGPFVSTGATPSFSTSYASPGDRLVRLRVRDPHGAVSTSTPIAIRVAAACSDGVDNDADGRIDFDGGASHPGSAGVGGPDSVCTSPGGNTEQESCGLGFEIALLLPLLRCHRLRRR